MLEVYFSCRCHGMLLGALGVGTQGVYVQPARRYVCTNVFRPHRVSVDWAMQLAKKGYVSMVQA